MQKTQICSVCSKEYKSAYTRKYCPDCVLAGAKIKKLGIPVDVLRKKSRSSDETWEIISCPENSWVNHSKMAIYQILESLRRGNFYPDTIIKDTENNFYKVVGDINLDSKSIHPQGLEKIL
jgi:hypothetical protein